MTCHNSVCEQKEKSDIFELVVEMLEEIKEKITAISVSKQGNIAAVHHNLKAEMRITVLALKVMETSQTSLVEKGRCSFEWMTATREHTLSIAWHLDGNNFTIV